MHGGNGRLQLEPADVAVREHPLQDRDALGDQGPVPSRPVLVGEPNQIASLVGPARLPGTGEQHQRQGTGDLVMVGQRSVQLPGEADGLTGQRGIDECVTGGARVPLVEDQMQDVENG